jgi:hypothetical protein
MTQDDPQHRAEQTAEDLEAKRGHLEEDIQEARRKAAHLPGAEDAPGEEVVGDFEDTEGGPMFGDDAVGAAQERGDHREQS